MMRLKMAVIGVVAVVVFDASAALASQSQLPAFTALSAEADPHTGSANFAVPIEVPPGRGGIQPNIQLQYNSSAPNGILGVGWNLELGAVQRSSKGGVPRYDDTDIFVMIQNGGVQELVLDTVTGLYRGKVEGAFMKIERPAGSWKVTDKSGIQYFFGETQGSQEYDPADGSRIFKWCLNRVQDAHGNEMTISYFRDENMLYPQDIVYTGNPGRGLPAFAQVNFEREARPEVQIDRYNTGFRTATRYRIGKITVKVDGNLQRRYDLIYDDSYTTGRSLLTSVAQFGSDGFSSLPPVTFSYQTPKNPDFNYNVTPLNNSVAGDNLWNYRSAGGYDTGHENTLGPVPPPSFPVSWGPTYTQSSGSNWSIDSKGNLTFSAGQDAAYWFWTYLYIDGSSPKTLTVPYTTQGVDGVWINQNYSTSVHNSWTLQPGYNLVEMTFYNQNQGFSFNLNYNLADNIDLMSSGTMILPQLSGDFNADGRTDVATFTAASGKVDVERSNGTNFAVKAPWINGFGVNGKLALGDFNGDGRMDIVGFDPASGNWRVGFSDGGKFNDAGLWLSGFGANEEPSTGDFNADGLADILTFYKASGSLFVRIALNKGGSFAALSGGQNIQIGSDSDTPVVGDFNGDGQVDFGAFNKAGGNWTIRLNTGDILAGLKQLPAVSGFGAGRNTVVSDFNYDGLTDIGYYDDATGKVVYRVSKGLSFANATELPFVFNIKGPNTQIQSGDYNGDTLIDFAVYNLIGKLEIAFSNGVMPDIVSAVDNGLGGQSSITYNAAVNYPQTFLPFPIQVVKSITQSNGLGESYTINNSYEQGLWDAQKREFRGFGLVRVTDPDGNYSDTFFAQDGIYKGRVTEQRTYDVLGRLYGKTVNTWAHQEIIPGSDFIYLERKDNFVYDGDATGRRTAEEFFFGETPQMGNLTKVVQLGEVDILTGGDTGNDTRTVETVYVQNTSGGSWIAGLPRLTTVKDNAGNIVRQAWFDYDNQGNTTAPVKGLLTKKEDWAGTGTGVVNPVTQYTYDTVGNLLTTTDSKGNITRVTYDTAHQMFPLTTENALGHKVINEYFGVNGAALSGGDGLSGLWGQVKSTTDPNQQQGKRSHDVFGRVAAAVSPLDSLALPTQTTAIEFLGSYTKVTTRQRVEHGKAATIDTVSFIDGFGRLAQTKARSETIGKYVLNGQAQYDSRGLKSRQYLPAFSTNPMDVIDAIDNTKPHTLITYDAMGRPVKTTNPDGTFASVSYDDWTTSAADENGHMQKSYFDAYGRLIKKEEYLGADGRSPNYPAKSYTLYATTLYTYDSEGNLLQTKDAYNNTTTITYDALGRKTAMDDPDMGHWSYQYDINGNLTKQIDAKGQTLTFTYDALNRLTNKTDGINGTVNVNYTYDNATASNFAKGRLTQAAYAGGNTRFAYDELGRELQSIKQMNTTNYNVDRGYDALSRLTHIQYPQGENVIYHYNAAGQIETVTNDPALVPPVTLTAPELYLIQTGSTELKLSWGSVIDATGYKIKYGTLSGNYTTTLDAGNTLSKVIKGLTNDTTYYFAAAAYNANTESGNSNERSATPTAPSLITMPSPLVQYAFNDSAANSTVTDTGSGTHQAITEQTSFYTSDLTGNGTASASSNLGGYDPGRAFDNDFTNWDGWVSNNTQTGWLAYEFSTSYKINSYVIWPRGHINLPYDGNPRNWTFEGFNGSGWDILDTRSYSSWVWQSPFTFNFANDTAYNKYRLNISANGGHGEVGLTEMEMMAYAPLHTNTLSSSGMVNASFNFNGTSQLINADSLLQVKNHSVGSISLWLNPDAVSVNGVVFSFGDTDGSNRVEVRAANDLEFYIANSVLNLRVSLPNALVAGLWSHITIVQDGSGIKGYVNGNAVAVNVLDQGLGLDAWFNSTWGIDNARVGCVKNNNQSNSHYYDGRLDDFRYYDYPLKASEVKALYNGGAGTEAKNPQYTDYTPLSKFEGGIWPQEKSAELVLKSEIRSTKYETKSNDQNMNDRNKSVLNLKSFDFGFVSDFGFRISNLASNAASWFERHVLGVGDAEAQAALPDSFKQETSSNGLVSIETENYHANVTPVGTMSLWEKVTTTGQSGTASMKANPNRGVINDTTYTTASQRLDYKIKFVKTGTHYIWIRGIGASTADDSIHAGLDGQALTTSDKIAGFTTSWTWSKTTEDAGALATINVTTVGEHTLNLWMREDGIVIDKIVVTVSSSYTPSGTGPAESPQVVPAAPVLSTPVSGNQQVSLSWNTVTGATGYRVKYGTTSGSYGTPIDVGNVISYTVNNLTNGTKYYFAVTAYNAGGESVRSNELSATPVAPKPSAPVLNSAVPSDKQVALSWGAVTGGTGYKIYYGTAAGQYGTPVSVGSVTTSTLISLTNGTAYYFAVSATNTSGESARSNELSATPVAPPPPAPVLTDAVPSDKQVALSWGAATGATGYKIYYGTSPALYGTPVSVGNTTTSTVISLTNGTTYYFAVSATNTSGESSRSNEMSATPFQSVPAAPVLAGANASDGQVVLTWTATTGATGYKVYYGTATGQYGTPTDVGNTTTKTVINLTNGTKYYFAVTAYNPGGEGVKSNELSATPLPPVPLVPVLNTAIAGDKQVTLSWSVAAGAAGYKVYYGTSPTVYGTPTDVGNVTTKAVTGLTNGTTYYFAVSAYNTSGGSARSNEKSAIPLAPPPPAPVLSSAAPGNGQVGLTWSASAGATGYKVYYGTTAGQYGTSINVSNTTTSTVTGLTNGTTYYFAVTAYNASSESVRSSEKSATPVAPPPTVTLTASPATITAGESAALTWSSTNAGSCTASGGWTGSKTIAGTANVTPSVTTVYTLTCTGPGGSASAGAEVTVNPLVVQETPTLYVKNVDYNAAGQMTKVEYGNGDVTTYTYNSLNLRLTRLYTVDKNGVALQDLNYTYDSVGNILSIDDKVNTAGQTFKYDDLNRLTEAAGQGYGTKTYVYDEIGNIVQKDGKTYFYGDGVAAGPHAVTALSDGTAFSYDANGNMVTKTEGSGTAAVTMNYTYDAENRLVKVVKNGSVIGQYEYDGDGGRTKKTATVSRTTTTTTFVGSLFETSGARNTKFIFLGGQRVAAVTNSPSIGSTTLYYHADHLGGANVLTDATGFKKELIEYDPFGLESRHEKYGSSEEVAWYYFTGKKTDDESGLIYFGARYYDPKLGRFITADDIIQNPTDPQTLNRYSYTSNNPVNRIDPDGHGWLQKFFKQVSKIFDNVVNWLENVTNSEWSVDIEVGQTYQFQDAKTATQSVGKTGVTLITQPWQVGVGFKNWLSAPRLRILETMDDPAEGPILGSSIENGDWLFVNGILNDEVEAIKNANRAGGVNKVAYNPSDGPVADLVEAFLQKLTFTSSFDRQLAKALVGHRNIGLVGHSQGAIIISNTLVNLGFRGQRNVVDYVRYINTQISQPRAFLSAALGGTRNVDYGTRTWDPSNFAGPNIDPVKFASGIIGLVGGGFGVKYHGILE